MSLAIPIFHRIHQNIGKNSVAHFRKTIILEKYVIENLKVRFIYRCVADYTTKVQK